MDSLTGIVDILPKILEHLPIESIDILQFTSKTLCEIINNNKAKLLKRKIVEAIKSKVKEITNSFDPTFQTFSNAIVDYLLNEIGKSNDDIEAELKSFACTLSNHDKDNNKNQEIETKIKNYPIILETVTKLTQTADEFKFIITLANVGTWQNESTKHISNPVQFQSILNKITEIAQKQFKDWLKAASKIKHQKLIQIIRKFIDSLEYLHPVKSFLNEFPALKTTYHDITFPLHHIQNPNEEGSTCWYELLLSKLTTDKWTKKSLVQFAPKF